MTAFAQLGMEKCAARGDQVRKLMELTRSVKADGLRMEHGTTLHDLFTPEFLARVLAPTGRWRSPLRGIERDIASDKAAVGAPVASLVSLLRPYKQLTKIEPGTSARVLDMLNPVNIPSRI